MRYVNTDESAGARLSLEKARAYAHLYVPADASFEEARAWLSQVPHLTKEDRTLICHLHSEDIVLAGWRSR